MKNRRLKLSKIMMYQYFGYLMYFSINNSVAGILKSGIFISDI